jgi:F-type H+-transporting ATPase subunit b
MIQLPNSNFLLPDATALIEAVVFLVVLVVVSKLVLPRLHTLMVERRRQIDDALRSAAETEAAARARHEEAASTLRAARRQARLIIDSAYERRDHLVAEGRRKGREEYAWSTRRLAPPESARHTPTR